MANLNKETPVTNKGLVKNTQRLASTALVQQSCQYLLSENSYFKKGNLEWYWYLEWLLYSNAVEVYTLMNETRQYVNMEKHVEFVLTENAINSTTEK